MLKMLEACRTCLGLIDEDNSVFYKIEAEDAKLSKEACRYKLLSLVPDMVLNVTSKLCFECYGSLEVLFKFKEKCLKTENIITQYLKAKPDVDMNNLDLKDVYTFNMGNSFVKEEVKEDFAAVDETITVVKHEIDDYLSETVEVVRPENTVLNSKEKSRKDRFGCHICDKRYGKKHELTLHLRKHNGERWHVCAVCGLSYFTSQRLRVHERIHTGERPYQCKECPMNFRSHNLLNQHRKIHAGIRNFKCEHCDKSFIKKWGLQKHLRLHTGEKPFCCDICDRRFVQKHHLTSHLRRHTGEEPYQCETCGMGFAVHGALTKHRQRVFPCESRKISKKKKESKIRIT